jgi:hypothetical protein
MLFVPPLIFLLPHTFPHPVILSISYDNNGKTMEECKALIDTFRGRVKHYVFVSSAGMYKVRESPPSRLFWCPSTLP